MSDFSEMMRRSPTINEFYLEWEGLRVFGTISITDVRNDLEIRFTSPHPLEEASLRSKPYSWCNARILNSCV